MAVAAFAAAALLGAAVLNLPYGYYNFLRLAVTSAGVLVCLQLRKTKEVVPLIGFVGIVLLFNPVFPVYLTREIWFWVDLLAAGIFFIAGLKEIRKISGQEKASPSCSGGKGKLCC